MIKTATLSLLLLSVFICHHALCQVDKARKQMQVYNYSEAIRILNKAITRSDTAERKEAIILLAECYRMQNDLITASHWYSRAIDEGVSRPDVLFNYAQSLRSCGH